MLAFWYYFSAEITRALKDDRFSRSAQVTTRTTDSPDWLNTVGGFVLGLDPRSGDRRIQIISGSVLHPFTFGKVVWFYRAKQDETTDGTAVQAAVETEVGSGVIDRVDRFSPAKRPASTNRKNRQRGAG